MPVLKLFRLMKSGAAAWITGDATLSAGANITLTQAGNDIEIASAAGGGGDSITVNGVAVVDADFDDATPAAPAGEVNVKWQKDASSPANVSASVQAATTLVKGVVELATDGEVAASVAVQGNDARLSNARTPTAHATSHQPGGSDAMAVDAAAATGSLRTIGTTATAACAGNDARLSDARTPTAHAASHKSGGSDSIKLDELAAPTDVLTLNASTLAHGLLLKLDGGTTVFLRGDGTWAAPTASAADPAYAPGTFTVATETGRFHPSQLILTGTQAATIEGTGVLSMWGV